MMMRTGGARAVVFLTMAIAAVARGDEEFVGPFASWLDLRAEFGAKGDGIADDTAALQKALDGLQKHERSCVIYIPAGIYRITDTVKTVRKAHHDCMGVAIIGEDPATTGLRWDGPAGGMMLKYDAWYSKISRLTLDGAGKAGAALAYGDAFSTYNETSDMVFQDAAIGMSMGTADNGQAENEVLRSTFRRCGRGIQTNNFNSMDIWAWYCRFEDCEYGLYNGAGNFHAYACFFLRSKKADIGSANLMVFSFIGNTSIHSASFLDFGGGHTWGSPTSITGNRIIEPTGEFAIRLGNGGPYLLADNTIRSRADRPGPAVWMTWGDQALIGNIYTVKEPVKEAGRFIRIAERIVDAKGIDAAPPELPPAPPHRRRPIFEVAAGAGAAEIQRAIDEAARRGGEHPVVHLPKGTYRMERTIAVPASSPIQIIGDGGAETATVLDWAGEGEGPILRLRGPSRATIRDLLLGAGRGRGIIIEDADQPGGRIFADQLNVSGRSGQEDGSGVIIDGVEESDVLLRCAQGGTFCDTWIRVIGGARRGSGGARGQVSVFCGATGTARAQYAVARGGELVVRSVYHEVSGESPQGILLDDAGSLTVDTTRFSYRTSPETPLVHVKGFRGAFALLSGMLLPVGTTHPPQIRIDGDGSAARVLCMGNMSWAPCKDIAADSVWRDESNPRARAAMRLSNLNGGSESGLANGFGRLDDRGEAGDAFILEMLAPLRRARIWTPGASPPGVTDVRLHRVIGSAGKGGACVEIKARSETAGSADPRRLRVAAAQPLVIPGDIDANIRGVEPFAAEAGRRGADLVLFSECAITGYDLKGVGAKAAIPIEDPALDRIASMALANGLAIVAGLYERRGGALHNTSIAFLPDGRRIVQRKHNIAEGEKGFGPIAPGERKRTIFDFRGLRFAILICADDGIPGIYDEIASEGCDAAILITAGAGSVDMGFHQADLVDPEKRKKYLDLAVPCISRDAVDRAIRLGLGLAACNQAGWDPATGYYHPGGSSIIDRTGEVTAVIPARFVFEHLRPDLAVGVISARRAEE